MAEPCSASDSHPKPPDNVVFIDTSLDTHIAVIVSNDDTVADVKKKILLEHALCYSSTGKIKIHSLKVKRRGCFYRLPDSMFVRRAFDGIKKRTWFLSVDASSLVVQSENQLPCNPDSGNLLLCLPSADGVDLQPDESYQELPIHVQSPLPQIKANLSATEKVLSDHLKVVEMEVKHISDDYHKTSFDPNKSDLEETCNLFSGEIELPETHTKRKKDDNGSLEIALKTKPAPKKRQKLKNKQKDAVSDHALKEDNTPVHASGKDTSQKENVISEDPVGNTGVQVSNDMKIGNGQLSDDPDEKSSSETSKMSDYGLQNKDDPCEEIQVQGTPVECQDIKLKDKIDVPCYSSLGEILQPRPAAKKKHKMVKSRESEGPVKDNKPLIYSFDKETSKAKIGSTENTLENKQDITNSNLDGLPPQLPEPECLLSGSSAGKRKRKKKSSDPCYQAVPEVPSEKDAREESSKATVEVDHKDSGRESDTTIVPGESIQNANSSRTCAPSLSEKYSEPVQVVEIPSLSPVIDMNEADASNVGRKSEASELGAAYEVKRKKSLKKHHAVDRTDHSVKERNGLRQDLDPSEQVSAALGDDQKAGIDLTNKIDEESNMSSKNDLNRIVSEKCQSSRRDGSEMNMKEVIVSLNLLEANVGVEHQKPAVKKRNSKKSKHTVEGTQVESNMEHARDASNGFALTEHHKALDGNHSTKDSDKGESILSLTERTQALHTKVGNTSLLGADREIDVLSGNEMESFRQAHVSKTQENTEDMVDDKPAVKRRNSKKSKRSVEGTQVESNKENARDTSKGFALTEHLKALDGNHSTKDSCKGEGTLSQTERTRALHTKVGNTSPLVADREIDIPSGNEMESFCQAHISKTQENTEDMMDDKPAVKRRNSKKSKRSVEGTQVESNMEHAKEALNGFALTKHDKALNGNHSTKDSDKGESILSQTERTLALQVGNTSLLGTDREIDALSGNEMESFHQALVSETQENAEDMMDDKVRKKTKKRPSSSAKNPSDLQIKELNIDPEVSTSSAHQFKVNVPSKIKRKTKSVNTKMETEKEAGTEVESLHLKQDFGNFDSTQIPSSDAPENNSVGPLKANVNGELLRLGGINGACDHKDVSSCQNDTVNFPKSLHEVAPPAPVLADKETRVKKSERESKVNKNQKLPNARALATSHDLQTSSNTNRSQGAETKALGDNELQDPLSMDVNSKLVPESDSKFSKVSRKGLRCHDKGRFDKIPEEVRWPKVVTASGTSSPVHTFMEEEDEASLSTSSSDSSEDGINYQNKGRKRQSDLDRYRVTIRKAPCKNTGEVVNSSQQSKSLLATHGSIFNDSGSESSEDDNASDASTRTPSDSSASSDYTEEQSKKHLDSSHGLYSAKRNESGAKGIGKSNSSASKNVAMDVILRSSSRYKKAKLTAVQAEVNDSESQPVEFVPDSQAN